MVGTKKQGLILCLLVLGLVPNGIAKTTKMKLVSRVKLPAQLGALALLEIPSNWSDPGNFSKLSIKSGQEIQFIIENLQAEEPSYIKYPEHSSRLGKFLVAFPLDRAEKVFALSLSNWVGGSNPHEFIVLSKSQKKGK